MFSTAAVMVHKFMDPCRGERLWYKGYTNIPERREKIMVEIIFKSKFLKKKNLVKVVHKKLLALELSIHLIYHLMYKTNLEKAQRR